MNQEKELLFELQQLKEKNRIILEENSALKEENNNYAQEVQRLTESNEKKNVLISQISHEIRTPLNIVIGMASIAKEDIEKQDKVKDSLSEIENSSQILLGIVDNLIDMSSIANGNFVVNSNKFDLKEQVTSFGIWCYERAKYRGVSFDIHVKGVSEEYLMGDEKRLQQILSNLFANSLRFTPAGGKIDLTVMQGSSSRNRVHMRFIMQDTGIGLTTNMVDELFVPYDEETNLEEQSYADTGISLLVTKQLVRMLGGTFEIETRSREGSKLIVDIPFEKTEQQEMDFSMIKNHKILLVADAKVGLERGKMLADMGVPYEMTANGYQALDMIGEAEENNQPFNVCMIDMNMKNFDPCLLIQEIKEVFGDQPIIIATTQDKKLEENHNIAADYFIDNTLFRSTIFDALMILERGKLYKNQDIHKIVKSFDFSRKRILVVEDVRLNMEVAVKLLSKVNATVICAGNGMEALQTFLQKPEGYFDCILMDVNMPIMDGYEATRQIRSSEKTDAKDIPIYAMTANAFSEDIAEALKAGMNGHIAKPIDVGILYSTLNKLFKGYENSALTNDLITKAEILEKQNKKLKEQAEHDPLTGLYNRYAYEKEIYLLLAKKEPIGFLLMDIDNFKEINDGYGHEVGDQVLKKVADTLKRNVRETDFVVRLGGDEFAVILRGYKNDPQKICEKVMQTNKELLHPTEDIPGVSLSVGAVFSDIGYSTDMYSNADKALYETKKNGRNGCTIYDEDKWTEEDDMDKILEQIATYMNFTFEGRPNMGEQISILAYRLLEYSMKVQIEKHYGISKQKELFREAGYYAGIFLVDQFMDISQSLEEFANQLVQLLEQLKIGNLVLDQMDEKTGEAILSVYEDADCSGLPSIGETVCHYDEGFIAGVLTAYTNVKYTATEVECWAKGDKVCRFEAKPRDN